MKDPTGAQFKETFLGRAKEMVTGDRLSALHPNDPFKVNQ